MNPANANLQYSQQGESLTTQFEGCALTAYRDSKGVLTIGIGHTRGVTPGMTCTREQAYAWLLEDIAWAASVVKAEVDVPLTQNEFDALTDFVFNLGSGNFQSSTLLRMLNAGDYAGAAAQFDLWDMAGGKVMAGLLRRRIAETKEFTLGEPQAQPEHSP